MAGGLVLLATRRSGHPLAGHLHQLIPDLRIRRQACKPDAILRISFHPSVSCHGAPPIRNPLTRPPIMIGHRKKFTDGCAFPKKSLYASVPLLETEVLPISLTARRLSLAGVGRRPKSTKRACPPSTWPRPKPGPFCGPRRSRPRRNISPRVRQALADRYRCSNKIASAPHR
jgi:hypothetical protein